MKKRFFSLIEICLFVSMYFTPPNTLLEDALAAASRTTEHSNRPVSVHRNRKIQSQTNCCRRLRNEPPRPPARS